MGGVPRIGVFGGTFDPPHWGHVRVATDVADHLGLDRVLWVPARVSPLKQESAPPSDAAARLEMVREAVALDPRFEVDARELARAGPSYTVDTLEELRAEHPDTELFLIVGADQFRNLGLWRAPERIVRLARLAVMDRAGASARDLTPDVAPSVPGLEAAVTFVPVTAVALSSSDVRAAIRHGADPASSVPEGVARLIRARGLYRG